MRRTGADFGARARVPWRSCAALLMGLMAFWAWAGAYTFAPGHIGWVMAGMDTPQHYLGWAFFRQAPWQWPAGANPTFGSDASGSIVLSDGIPIVALTLKLISPILPLNFQYLGLWACSCFLMQGWMARKLMTRITSDVFIQLFATGLFLTATIFMVRVYLHPALATQWLILAGFYLALDEKFRARAWMLLLPLTVCVHAYLFIMVASIWIADLTRRWWGGDYPVSSILKHGVAATVAVSLCMWVAGYFMPGPPLASTWRAHFDLVEPFWTGIRFFGEWSWIVPPMDMDVPAYEGFSYLGLGFMVLLAIAALVLFTARAFGLATYEGKSVATACWIALGAVTGILLLFAVGDHVYFAQHLLFSYTVPRWLDHIYGIFRGSARMIWPAWYLLLFGVLYVLLRRVPLRYLRYLMAFALLVQLADLSKATLDVRRVISKSVPWHQVLLSRIWESLPSGGIKHVAYMKSAQVPAGMITFVTSYKVIANYAAQNGMSINVAYLARTDDVKLAQANALRANLLMSGQVEVSTVYVVDDDPLWKKLACQPHSGQWLGTVDGMRIILPTTFPNLAALPAAACVR